MFKKRLLGAVLAASLLVTGANAFSKRNVDKEVYLSGSDGKQYQIVFATGGAGGTWDKGAQRLKDKTGIDRKTRGSVTRVENVNGTGDIIYHMKQGEANAGFIQGDYVPELLADKEFSKGKSFIKLAPETMEKIQLIMRKGMDEGDLQKKIDNRNPVVFAGRDGSGGVHSAEMVKKLEPSYIFEVMGAERAEDYDYDITAITALLNGEIDAIIKTSNPIPSKDEFGNIIRKTNGIHLVDFDDYDLNDKMMLPNGKEEALYVFTEFNYTGGLFSSDTEAPGVPTYLVIDKKNMSKDAYKRLLKAINSTKYNPFK